VTLAPIRRAVIVAAPVETAFAVFTDDFGDWWPLDQHSALEAGGTVAMTDGEIVEVSASGQQAHWGSVLVWEPPHRVAFSWHPGHPPSDRNSQVDVRFTDLDGQTLVVLEHSGWEVFDDPASARNEYGRGWPQVIARYAAAISGGEIFVVLHHRPGPGAVRDVPLLTQPGFADHLAFLSRLEKRRLVMAAGPFPDSAGEGMTVLRLPAELGLAEATRLATQDDQSVASGFLAVEVKPWQVVMHS
jgi:uncharacterized protein YndB with AHSA1/START domain/uncharacterized protein YciI